MLWGAYCRGGLKREFTVFADVLLHHKAKQIARTQELYFLMRLVPYPMPTLV